MNILNYLDKGNIIFCSKQKDKSSLISFILEHLISCNKLAEKDKKDILATIIEREEMGSTAIGGRIAFPHARIGFIKDVLLSVCIIKDGVDFDSLDEEPVNIVVLLLSGKKQAGTHLKVLAFLARMLRDKYFVQRLKAAEGGAEVINLLSKQQKAVS